MFSIMFILKENDSLDKSYIRIMNFAKLIETSIIIICKNIANYYG